MRRSQRLKAQRQSARPGKRTEIKRTTIPRRREPFRHPPLDEQTSQIRFLTLLPGSDAEPVRCEMGIHSLDDSIDFTALSYCWGNPTPIETITIDGAEVRINHSLAVTLPYLRQDSTPRVLWVAAVCIDQSNTQERNLQVRLMARWTPPLVFGSVPERRPAMSPWTCLRICHMARLVMARNKLGLGT
ncbi:heterokaryon incompatibility protein-domain-containing protein [Apodospora peruviana]|uniref:Heterokaryon incompatibility protein-domain-containing protein n=1 Tax=Apodospora peruviana TaxID=516989 RepID=A0AAE0I1A8_9PEZI|nr:heterokaryon incompatibility protein-domain-containing protein [Apodospora peruviana]